MLEEKKSGHGDPGGPKQRTGNRQKGGKNPHCQNQKKEKPFPGFLTRGIFVFTQTEGKTLKGLGELSNKKKEGKEKGKEKRER